MSLINDIKEIAKQNPQGFTISIKTLEHVTKGWVVARIETQNSFGDIGLERVIEVAKRTSYIIGGWKEGKFYYYDAVDIYEDKQEAIEAGRQNEQIAIYNIETATLIYL